MFDYDGVPYMGTPQIFHSLYYFHLILIYGISFLGAIYFVGIGIKSKSSRIAAFTIFLPIIYNILFSVARDVFKYDFTAIFFSVTFMFFSVSLYRSSLLGSSIRYASFYEIVDTTNTAAFIYNKEIKIVYMNIAAGQLLRNIGYTNESDEFEELVRYVAKAATRVNPPDLLELYKRPDFQYGTGDIVVNGVTMRISFKLLSDGNNTQGYILLVDDVTEYAKVKEYEQIMSQRMFLLEKYSPSIVLFVNSDNTISFSTDIFNSYFGVTKEEIQSGVDYTDIFKNRLGEEQYEKVLSIVTDAVKDNKSCQVHIKIMTEENGLRDFDISVAPYSNESQVWSGVLLIFHDITRELEAIRTAEDASNAKSIFLANMSHEIRTPLTAIVGMTQIGLKAGSNEEQKENAFIKIRESSDHLIGVINDILDISKIEAGKLELSDEVFAVKELFKKAGNIIKFKIEEKHLSFHSHIDDKIPDYLVGDSGRFLQVVLNLLSNAVKFTDEDGKISFVARLEEIENDYARISVNISDTGIGIEEKNIEKLFSNFSQADNRISRNYGGTGLGLAISKCIAEMMGGGISVKSTFGKGSSFTFSSRLKVSDYIPAEQAIISEKSDFSGKRILVAEDVEINQIVLSSLLEDTKIEIDFAGNGIEAIEKYEANPDRYSLILMDIHMPKMDGYETTKRLREMGVEIPIIAVTANVFKEDVEKCLEYGMNDHISKPFNIEVVIEKLNLYI
jgi:signal transduction histidine kinase